MSHGGRGVRETPGPCVGPLPILGRKQCRHGLYFVQGSSPLKLGCSGNAQAQALDIKIWREGLCSLSGCLLYLQRREPRQGRLVRAACVRSRRRLSLPSFVIAYSKEDCGAQPVPILRGTPTLGTAMEGGLGFGDQNRQLPRKTEDTPNQRSGCPGHHGLARSREGLETCLLEPKKDRLRRCPGDP